MCAPGVFHPNQYLLLNGSYEKSGILLLVNTDIKQQIYFSFFETSSLVCMYNATLLTKLAL